jgi:DNA-directed RNA polymerase sigma subunit (sigma70/sigma32)
VAAAQSDLAFGLDQALTEVLTERERVVLRLRFGLGGGQALALGDIAPTLGLSRERVRQIEAVALAKLRHPRVRSQLREYLEGGLAVDPHRRPPRWEGGYPRRRRDDAHRSRPGVE